MSWKVCQRSVMYIMRPTRNDLAMLMNCSSGFCKKVTRESKQRRIHPVTDMAEIRDNSKNDVFGTGRRKRVNTMV